MALLELICPHSPGVWYGNGISECFDNIYPLCCCCHLFGLFCLQFPAKILFVPYMHMALGLGANLLTSVVIVILGLLARKERGYHMRERHLSEKMFFHVIHVLGAILMSYDLLLLPLESTFWMERDAAL